MRAYWTKRERLRAILARGSGEVFSVLGGNYHMRPENRAPSFIYVYSDTLMVFIWGTYDEVQVVGATTVLENSMIRDLVAIAFENALREEKRRLAALRNPLSPTELEELVMGYVEQFNPLWPTLWGPHSDVLAREWAIKRLPPEHKEAIRKASRSQCDYARGLAEEVIGILPNYLYFSR